MLPSLNARDLNVEKKEKQKIRLHWQMLPQDEMMYFLVFKEKLNVT